MGSLLAFLFQPAEEGAPEHEEGGAPRMIAEGALEQPKVSAIYGLHQRPEEPFVLAVRDRPLVLIYETLKGVCAIHGGRYDFVIEAGSNPPTMNLDEDALQTGDAALTPMAWGDADIRP